jgi:hypothetical protein
LIIIKKTTGQLANKLHYFSYFISNSIEYDYKLIIACFPEYFDLFKPETTTGKVTVLNRGLIRKLLVKVLASITGIKIPFVTFHSVSKYDADNKAFDMNDQRFLKQIKSSIVIPDGWQYRDYSNLKKHQKQIREFFSPLDCHKKAIRLEIDSARKKGDILIGVHIRRTDYRDFYGGKWFYQNNVYASKMQDIEQVFTGKRCVFIICSDELVDIADFNNFSVLISERTPIVDLYLLAECDYIIGPPSTFSAWASFYNDVPFCHIETPDQAININAFGAFI